MEHWADGNTPPKFKIQHERSDAGALLVFIFPHKPARIGALWLTCCPWWPWSAFPRALVCRTEGSSRAFPGYGESHTAVTPVLTHSLLLCLHKSHSYLFMKLSLGTGTAPSATAVYLQHVAATLSSTHQHEIRSYGRACAINKTLTVSEKLFSAQLSALCCLFLFNNKNRCFLVFLLLQMYRFKCCQLFKDTADFWRAERAVGSSLSGTGNWIF